MGWKVILFESVVAVLWSNKELKGRGGASLTWILCVVLLVLQFCAGNRDNEHIVFVFLQQLASVGLEDYSQVTIWDWKKGKALASTRGHSDRVSE